MARYLKTIGITSNQPVGRGLDYPYDTAMSSDGRIFVLNRSGSTSTTGMRIQMCTFDEEWLGEFGNGTFESPAGIAVDKEDNPYVVEQCSNQVRKLIPDGKPILRWGEQGSGCGQFNLPWGVGVDSSDNVYVADWRNDRIQRFAPDGTFLASFGEPETGDGQDARPSGVAVDPGGYTYVADWGNERVQVLRPDGGFQQVLRGQATLPKWAEEFFAANPDEMKERMESNLLPLMVSLSNHAHPRGHRLPMLLSQPLGAKRSSVRLRAGGPCGVSFTPLVVEPDCLASAISAARTPDRL